VSLSFGIDPQLLERTLCQLGRVDRIADLGRGGPLHASVGENSWFDALFGRDALRMALDLLEDFPVLARATLVELASIQGVRRDDRNDEEPGRIIHELRKVENPQGKGPVELGVPYYGAIDSTPIWIVLLAQYYARHDRTILDERIVDRLERSVTLRDSLSAAIGWLESRLDEPGGGGYLWVRRSSPTGLANQVWEDSWDAYYYEDGTVLNPKAFFAPVAAQGYAYDALVAGADLLDHSERYATGSARLRERARVLHEQVVSTFWQPDLGTFAQAVTLCPSGAIRPARVLASSPGHLLGSGLLAGEASEPLCERLVERLMSPDMLAGAGIRTKSTRAARFHPGSYHNGTTWPMDTGVIAEGMRRHGYTEAADELEMRILRACAQVGGFPEFFRGDLDGSIAVNTEIRDVVVDGIPNRLEQPPQALQGWTATRVWRILRGRGAITLD
jgi:glycogen debranching enzyme